MSELEKVKNEVKWLVNFVGIAVGNVAEGSDWEYFRNWEKTYDISGKVAGIKEAARKLEFAIESCDEDAVTRYLSEIASELGLLSSALATAYKDGAVTELEVVSSMTRFMSYIREIAQKATRAYMSKCKLKGW